MATYLPNVNRYVSKTKAFTPDFKFLSDALDKRQDRYDTNYKKMNNLYGSVLHADLSREDNMGIRDEYVRNLAPRIQQISGMDLSLQQNVDAAKGVFTPFFEDEKTVRDIVFTKRYKSEMQKFDEFRKSDDEKIRSKWWEGGVKMMNWSLDDFKNATREGSMSVQLPELVERVDLVESGFNALKNSGMKIKNVSLSKDGHYIITQENGTLLTRRPAGKDPVTDQMIYYNPAQNFILQTMMDDPNINRYYQTKFYVEARTFWEQNAEQYGGIEGAKKAFAEQTIATYGQNATASTNETNKEVDNSVTGMSAWDSYKTNGGDLIPGSDEMTTFERHEAEMEYLTKGQKLMEKRNADILGEPLDIDDLMRKAGEAYMHAHIDSDTRSAAAYFADIDASETIEADKFALDTHKHNLTKVEKEIDRVNKLNQTAFEKGYLMTEDGFTPLPWAEGGNNTHSANSTLNKVVAGDGATTGEYAIDEEADIVQLNINTTNEGLNKIKGDRFALVESFYSDMANDISTDDNTYSAHGMEVDGKFMTWAEAKKYYVEGGNGDKLKELSDNILKKLKEDFDDVAGPDLERSHPELFYKLQSINNGIDNTTAKLLVGWSRQKEVYTNVIDLMTANKEITMLERRMLDAYPLFNSRGVMAEPEEIQNKMVQDFGAYINGTSDLSAEDAAASFGFYSVEDMNKTIDGAKSGGVKVAEKHFNNVFDEFWGKHSIEGLFNDVKTKMNRNMNKASAVNGVQNYNLQSHMTNQNQAGGGALIYDIHSSEYVVGQFNPKAEEQIDLITELLSGPSQNYIVQLGDKSAGYGDGASDPEAINSLNEFLADHNIAKLDPEHFGKGKGPNATIAWSERLGAKGDKSGWVITYREEYADGHKSSKSSKNNIVEYDKLKSNSITVFASTEYGEKNPNSVKNAYVGTTDYLVDLNKSRIITNDGGTVIFYRNSNQQMVYKASLNSYNKETGNIEPGQYTKPTILNESSEGIDMIFNRMGDQLKSNAKDNQSAMKAHKSENSTTENQ